MFDDDQETPNTLTATFEFDDNGKKKMMVFEVRHWMSNHEAGHRRGRPGAQHRGRGLLRLQRVRLSVWDEDHGRYQSFLGRELAARPFRRRTSATTGPTSSRRCARASTEDLNAPIEEGAISTTLVHLANISYRVGRTLHFDAAGYTVRGDAEANRMFRREYRKPFVVPEKV